MKKLLLVVLFLPFNSFSIYEEFSTPNDKDFLIIANWNDNSGNYYMRPIKIKESDFLSSVKKRTELASTANNWMEVYINLIGNDVQGLENLIKTFNNIALYNSDRNKFSDIVVSFVQSIPYMIPKNKLGIYGPVEFIKKYEGDCDTRTVLLYLMLSNYGYDVVILNSDLYRHSIIGIKLPSPGHNYKYYKGTRYYAWETTAKGWTRGLLRPSYSKMSNWKVILPPLSELVK